MNMKKILQLKRPGMAMPLAVVAIMILLAMGVGLLSLGLNSRIYAIRSASDIAARCAADDGLEIALYEMNQNLEVKPWTGETLPKALNVSLPYSDEICSYLVKGDSAGNYTVWSIGESGGFKRGVRATLKLRGLFEHAILTKGDLVLKSGTVIDGYNSSDPLDTDADVDIGTQSTEDQSIVLNAGVEVNGDVIVGVGGDPDDAIKDLGATTESQFAGTENDPMPEITAPPLPNMGPSIFAKGNTVTITPAESGQYGKIDVRQTSTKEGVSPGILEINGGDVVLHITGDIKLGSLCEIVVANDSTLTLYVDGNIDCGEGSGINTQNPTKSASTLYIYATGDGSQNFDIKANGDFTGVIYAPNADVDLYAGGDAFGSIVADTFEFKAGGNYYYDEALRDVEIDDIGVRFVVDRWYEAKLPSPDAIAAFVEAAK
ncbi:MAG: hypothetical protein CEE38_20150 [Planctomycetes bacterium B3_Pla]|nr:MAG: hypothetical protein CEE38_20150 [Planctomycetes bacterium B3_Pla]